ncbi:MAG TPA: YeeE/YedE thiosulfate transporter family protein [Gemmatimonadaceae bacterium]|nr:YeeE/YedE thiosulfate transporter family protein [Gemmatimonadaceae bacterium]
MSLFYALLVGIAMGALIQRVGASSPRMILASLRLENVAIMKFMATTIAVGTVVAYAMSYFVPMHFDVKPTYVIGVVVGGLIFGTGFAVGGYCPGTCVVGVGEGRRDAIAAVVGGIAGALLFTLVYTLIEAPLIKPMSYGKITLFGMLHLPPMIVAVALAVLFIAGVTLLPTVPRARRFRASATS